MALLVFVISILTGGSWSWTPWIALVVVGVMARAIETVAGECNAD